MPIYVPWQVRAPKQWSGWQRPIVAAATALYRSGAPVISRFPGLIFISAVAVTCLATWAVAALFADVNQVLSAADVTSGSSRVAWLSIGEIRRVITDGGARTAFPAWLLWLVQAGLVRDLVALAGIVGLTSVFVAFGIWWERKVSAFMQSRLGPMRVGGWHGWAQSIADGIKLLAKEDLIPAGADRTLFRLAPYLCFVPALAAYLALPFGAIWAFRDLDVALLIVLAMLGLQVLGVLLAGWASNNKWSMYGAMREACQVVSYEIPLTMSLLVPIMISGTLRLSQMAEQQAGGWFHWYAWHSPFAFVAMVVFFIASLAQCKRAPFDLPEAESELVAGFHTEYSGFRWSLFFFAEYVSMFSVSGLLTILFLGAWDSPIAFLPSGPLWFVAKCIVLVFVQMWLRWTLPRLRIDQVVYSCVQVIVPLMFVVVIASAGWEVLRAHAIDIRATRAAGWAGGLLAVDAVISMVLGLCGLATVVGIGSIALRGFRNRMKLVGTLAVERPMAGR